MQYNIKRLFLCKWMANFFHLSSYIFDIFGIFLNCILISYIQIQINHKQYLLLISIQKPRNANEKSNCKKIKLTFN